MKMKKITILTILSFLLVGLIGCEHDTPQAGSQGMSSDIVVKVDTAELTSSLVDAKNMYGIYSTPDSFLLGECDNRFGTLHADVLTQLACPIGFQYPEGAVLDSACLYVYYRSFFGDGKSPLTLDVYEMDGEVMQFNQAYSCFSPIERFVSPEALKKSIVTRKRTILAGLPTDSASSDMGYVPYVRFRMTDEWANKLFGIRDFSSQDNFNQLLHGLYITSVFGGSTILHVNDIAVALYYHFPYTQIGQTDTIWEKDVKGFYANPEVRQINRYEYIHSQFEALKDDTTHYIVSPSNIFTQITLPLRSICRNVHDSLTTDNGSKRAYINRALIPVEVLNYESSNTPEGWARPSAYMLMVEKETAVHFFRDRKLPNDTTAILATLTAETDSLKQTHYYYKYDLSTLLTRQVRRTDMGVNYDNIPESMDMVLIPVDVTSIAGSNGNTSISSVTHKQTVTTTVIRSANEGEGHTRWEIVFSGF